VLSPKNGGPEGFLNAKRFADADFSVGISTSALASLTAASSANTQSKKRNALTSQQLQSFLLYIMRISEVLKY
jgi:hypothetical protein